MRKVRKVRKVRKPASIEREARNPRKAEKGAWLRFAISRREKERIYESAFGPGNSPPLLLTGKGQLASPTAL